jgi:hypothetical protein
MIHEIELKDVKLRATRSCPPERCRIALRTNTGAITRQRRLGDARMPCLLAKTLRDATLELRCVTLFVPCRLGAFCHENREEPCEVQTVLFSLHTLSKLPLVDIRSLAWGRPCLAVGSDYEAMTSWTPSLVSETYFDSDVKCMRDRVGSVLSASEKGG